MENPEPSFLWLLGLFQWPGVIDTAFSPCMLGDALFKPTRIKSLGIRLPSMTSRCVWYEARQIFKCGRTKDTPHVHLSSNNPGEPRMDTSAAAVYQPGTVIAWAKDILARCSELALINIIVRRKTQWQRNHPAQRWTDYSQQRRHRPKLNPSPLHRHLSR